MAAIATTTDWFTEQYLKGKGFTNLISSPLPVTNVKQLMNGEVQISVFTDITIPEIVKNTGYNMDDLEPVFTVSNTYFYIAISLGTGCFHILYPRSFGRNFAQAQGFKIVFVRIRLVYKTAVMMLSAQIYSHPVDQVPSQIWFFRVMRTRGNYFLPQSLTDFESHARVQTVILEVH